LTALEIDVAFIAHMENGKEINLHKIPRIDAAEIFIP
jgi:hypothetical protein